MVLSALYTNPLWGIFLLCTAFYFGQLYNSALDHFANVDVNNLISTTLTTKGYLLVGNSANNDGFKKSGAATVADNCIVAPLIAAKKAKEEGEIYICADGKKVCHMKKMIVKQVTLSNEQDRKPLALSKMMDNSAASKVGCS